MSKATISTPQYLLDQAKRRLTPTVNTIPGMGLIEKRLLNVDWKQRELAEPPPGSGLKPVMGDRGLPVLGHLIEMFREGPDFPLHPLPDPRPGVLSRSRRSCRRSRPSVRTPPRPSSPTATRTTRRRAGIR